MEAMRASLLVTANADQAKKELAAAGAALQRLGTDGKAGGQAASAGLKAAETQIANLNRELATMKVQLDQAMASERQAATQISAMTGRIVQLETALGRGGRSGGGGLGGSVGNLTAQFNDIGQMLMAGQSPLMLAAQQGTQVSQVLGPMGARGAVAALGQAFLGMISPVNLAIFAAVAGLGFLGQALQSIGGETVTVKDALDDLGTAAKSWQDEAATGSDDLLRQFGKVTPEILRMQREITDLRLAEYLLKAAEAATALGHSLDGAFLSGSQRGNIADLLGVDRLALAPGQFPRAGSGPTDPRVGDFQKQLETLSTSSDLNAQLAAVQQLKELIKSSADAQGKLSEGAMAYLGSLLAVERSLRTVQAAQEGIGTAQAASKQRAEEMLTSLREEANIRSLTVRKGEEAREVAEAQVAAERRKFEASLQSLDVSDQMKTSLREAWEAANGLDDGVKGIVVGMLGAAGASDDVQKAVRDAWDAVTGSTDATNAWAAAMSGVAAEVNGIAAAVGAIGKIGLTNASKQVELEALQAGKSVAEAKRTAQADEYRREAAAGKNRMNAAFKEAELKANLDGLDLDRQVEAARKVANERDRLERKGARGGAKDKTDPVEKLTASLQRDLDLLRATDPVQKEMIRNREALAGATAKERQEVEALIAAKLAEEKANRQAKETWEWVGNTAFDVFDRMIIQGEKASSVMADLAKTIAHALLQSALLGTGPLAGIFGGQGTGLFGMIGEALGFTPAAADGGYMTGPGGPRDDAILARLSNGEFVVNAASTARHRPLLEAINGAPRFANGGLVGGGGGAGAAANSGSAPAVIELRLSDDLNARIVETSQQVAVRVTRGGLEEYDAKVLPRRMKAVSADPRRVG